MAGWIVRSVSGEVDELRVGGLGLGELTGKRGKWGLDMALVDGRAP